MKTERRLWLKALAAAPRAVRRRRFILAEFGGRRQLQRVLEQVVVRQALGQHLFQGVLKILSFCGPKDAAFAVSFTPYASATIDFMRQAAARNTPMATRITATMRPTGLRSVVSIKPNRATPAKRMAPAKVNPSVPSRSPTRGRTSGSSSSVMRGAYRVR